MIELKNILLLADRPVGRQTLGRLFVALFAFASISAAFLYTAREVIEGETVSKDTHILLFINSFSSALLDRIMIIVTTLGDVTPVLAMTTIILAFLYWKKRWQAFALLVFSMAGAALLNIILKLIFERQRPHLWDLLIHESTYSFPSGHAMLTSTLVLVVILICWKTKWRIPVVITGIVYVLAVGFSRMYLGVHYPTDIFAGWCVATIWVIAVATTLGTISWQEFKPKLLVKRLKSRT